MTELKLLPCPFCGVEGDCNNNGVNDMDGNPVWWVECPICGANIEGKENSREAAIAAWNHRACQYVLNNLPMPVIIATEPNREYVDSVCPRCKDIITQERKGQKQGLYRPRYHDGCGQRLEWPTAEKDGEQ